MNTLLKLPNLLKKLSLAMMMVILVSMPVNTAFADDPQPPTPDTSSSGTHWKTVPTNPNRVLSPAAKKLRNAKYKALKQFIQPSGVSATGGIPTSALLVVGTWKEPNDNAHVNHCGPGATQVALDARWAASKVYNIDKIATDEKTNVNGVGTNMQDIVKTLNSQAYLGSQFPNPNGMQGYWLDLAQNETDLFSKISFDTTHGYALISGLNTKGMPGWGTKTVPHIVAVIGYDFTTSTPYVKYVETAAPKAGFNGSYRNTVSITEFFGFVKRLNTLAW